MPKFSRLLYKTESAGRSVNSQAPMIPVSAASPPPAARQSLSNKDWGLSAYSELVRASRAPASRASTAGRPSEGHGASSTPGQGSAADGANAVEPAGLTQPILVIRRSIFNSWLNVLLLLVPIGIASHPAKFPDVAVFIINFFAIVPLAKILGYATEQLALHLGEALGGLLNATFGNAVELLVGILALVKGEIEIVQTSLVGSILSNLLLVGGCCFFFGGLRNNEQVFNVNAAQSYGSLLAMAILSTLLPAAFNFLHAKETELKSGILTLSHVTAIFLLITYIAYLVFQLKTHSNLFETVDRAEREEAARKPSQRTTPNPATSNTTLEKAQVSTPTEAPDAIALGTAPVASQALAAELHATPENAAAAEDEEEEVAELTVGASLALLLVITGLTGVCAEFLVDSIDGLTTKWNLSPSFVGMILLPIVGNAAEHVTAITVAWRNKMDLAIGVAVGSSIQIALFVTPFLCIIGWIIKQPMTIFFSPFTTVVLFVTVILVNYIIGDGRTNWLEGMILIVAYIIIGVAYFLYPKTMENTH